VVDGEAHHAGPLVQPRGGDGQPAAAALLLVGQPGAQEVGPRGPVHQPGQLQGHREGPGKARHALAGRVGGLQVEGEGRAGLAGAQPLHRAGREAGGDRAGHGPRRELHPQPATGGLQNAALGRNRNPAHHGHAGVGPDRTRQAHRRHLGPVDDEVVPGLAGDARPKAEGGLGSHVEGGQAPGEPAAAGIVPPVAGAARHVAQAGRQSVADDQAGDAGRAGVAQAQGVGQDVAGGDRRPGLPPGRGG